MSEQNCENCQSLQVIVDKLLPQMKQTTDGEYYIPLYAERRDFWAVWRYEDTDEWLVSQCHTPRDEDEASLDWDWILDCVEDACEIQGVYSTEAAALAAKEGE